MVWGESVSAKSMEKKLPETINISLLVYLVLYRLPLLFVVLRVQW
jgi:hypothetical protein